MATVIYIKEKRQSPSAMRGVIAYCSQEMKTVDALGRRYLSGVNCAGENALQEFLLTKEAYHKTDFMNFYQYVQSFSPDEPITFAQAHVIALEFAAKAWPGYEVLVVTHCDAAHPHSHFVINSVSFENGKKLRQHPDTLTHLRVLSDEICAANGFSVIKTDSESKQEDTQKMSAREYRSADKGGLETGSGNSGRGRDGGCAEQRRICFTDGGRGLWRHLDAAAEVPHLSMSQRHEVPGQQAARTQVYKGGNGTCVQNPGSSHPRN